MDLFEWKGVQALNNMAVTMLESSCFQQAARTLQDSILLLQQTLSGQQRSRKEVSDKLEAATRYMFNLEQASVLVATKVVFHDGAVEESPRAPDKLRVIRLETNDMELRHEAMALLIHNMAICRLGQAMSNAQLGATSYAQSQGQSGVRLLQSALNILSGIYDESQCPFTIYRIISLMMIVAGTLAQTMECLGQMEDATVLRATLLVSLEEQERRLKSTGLLFSTKPQVSSAA
jgi:hypothetical protein